MLDAFTKWVLKTPPLQIIALVLAAPAMTALAVFMLYSVIHHGWDKSQQALQLEILREAIAYTYAIIVLIMGALAAGLIKGFKIGAGKISAEVDLSDDEDDKWANLTVRRDHPEQE